MDKTSVAHSFIKTLAGVVFEVFLVVISVMATFAIGAFLDPMTVDTTLAPAGIEQGGWPLPFQSASYSAGEGVKLHDEQGFNIITFGIDFLLFYCFIRLATSGLKRIWHPVLQKNDPHHYVYRYAPYVVLAIAALLIGWYLQQLQSVSTLNVGVPESGAPALVQE